MEESEGSVFNILQVKEKCKRAQDRVEGTVSEGFCVEVCSKLVSLQWGYGVQGQRWVSQGVPVVALAIDPKSFPV